MWILLFLVGNYVASPAEHAWHADNITGRICEIASSRFQIHSMQLALQRDPVHLSYIDGHPIEPLSGVARHPFASVGCNLPHEVSEYDISHIIIRDFCGEHDLPASRGVAKYIDMGCTSFSQVRRASGAGPSIPLFIDLYNRSCVRFDEIWGWEVTTMKNWWQHVPLQLKPRIHFYNTPVNAAEFHETISRASPADFVVVKLDIDNTPVEMDIMRVVETHAHLIDELFFEYHFYYDGNNFGWGDLKHLKSVHNVSTAIRMMTRLRRRGIRAHFWV